MKSCRLIDSSSGQLKDAGLVAFAKSTLLPAYEDDRGYARTSATRGSSLAALKRKRLNVASADLAASLRVPPSEAELAMEASFRQVPPPPKATTKGGKK